MDKPVARARPARELISLIADEGSFEAWDEGLVSSDPLGFVDSKPYTERLAEAQRRSGNGESVVTGRVVAREHPAAVIAGDFSFLGGSIGVATGEIVARAFERAADERLPVVALPSSGGTRMQEGSLAFMQMLKTVVAVRRFRQAALPYIAYLTHPTMGGVLASWGSLAHLTFAMPGALIGFTGPRVMELATGTSLEEGTQSAENLLRRGLIDDVFPPEELADRLARLLSLFDDTVGHRPPGAIGDAAPARAEPGDAAPARAEPGDAWESVLRSRQPNRPGAREFLELCSADATALSGDAVGGGDDPSCRVVVARLAGIPAVVVAQDRSAGGRMGPSGFRKARRGIALAGELGLPLVTVIDTSGAQTSVAAEEGGLAAEIARCLADLTGVPSPTLAVLLGQGAGGGALALLPADRVVCAEHAWLAPVAPEGASAILYGIGERAADLARAQGVASWDLLRFGIVDLVVAEDPSGKYRRGFLVRLCATIAAELRALATQASEQRLAARMQRYRESGDVSAMLREGEG